MGQHIRDHVLPNGMTVSAAAERLGVGRPALSNLLNGNADLSSDMATRLQDAFGADAKALLEQQAAVLSGGSSSEGAANPPRAYAPPLLSIKAAQLANWVSTEIQARQLLPVLLRKLIHSTGIGLRLVDFPGYDNAERKGVDGRLEADVATAWIPAGSSVWEFSVTEDPQKKANADYAARLRSMPRVERLKCVYVQVTPRNWEGKIKWEAAKNAAGEWKSVRALDASDLEQWLEESIPAQMWLAERLQIPTSGFQTLDDYWQTWRQVADPALPAELFAPSVEAHGKSVELWLSQPSEEPFVVAADSKGEALAFLACLFQSRRASREAESGQAWTSADLAIVFESGAVLKKVATATTTFIPIALTDDAEVAISALSRQRHCITVKSRNAFDREPDIAIDLLTPESFEKALTVVGLEQDEAERLGRESGYSPTILRRLRSNVQAIRCPAWAETPQFARALIPIALIGAWHAGSKADREIVEAIAGRPYAEVETELARLLQVDDTPVWSVGEHRGVTSKNDALFAISRHITAMDMERFLDFAEYVLSERDPALDLPEDKRWAAGIYGKTRDHSAALRSGVCESLVILVRHEAGLFGDRLQLHIENRVAVLILRLLKPLSLDKLVTHERDLPRYAEAAPEAFLSVLEKDIATDKIVFGLLMPAGSGPFGRCLRTGLLWALETLSWSPKYLHRVIAILAELSTVEINDNWVNKPIGSLSAIFRCWMPQTAAPLDVRIAAIERLAKVFPKVAWQLLIEQFEPGSRIGHYSRRPEWRNDASGAGQVVSRREAYEFSRRALDIALAWPKHDEKTLSDLIECIGSLTDEDAALVWERVNQWREGADDVSKSRLREAIRRYAFTRRARHRNLSAHLLAEARSNYEALQPTDLAIRHAWLFAKHWVEESAEEVHEDNLDYSKRGERIHRERQDAMRDVWAQKGLEGALKLLETSEAPDVVGVYAAGCVVSETEAGAVLRSSLSSPAVSAAIMDRFLEGFLGAIDAPWRRRVLDEFGTGTSGGELLRVVQCAPFTSETWRFLDDKPESLRHSYWSTVTPRFSRITDADLAELIDRLLEARRPRAAFHLAHFDWEKVETSQLARLLEEVTTHRDEPAGTYLLDRYEIGEALTSLAGRPGITDIDMARLEFRFIDALDFDDRGIPHLEKQLAESPALFAQSVALAFKRSDGQPDPPEFNSGTEEQRSNMALAAYRLLEKAHRTPGTEVDGSVNAQALMTWISESRRLCSENGRPTMGDQTLGQLLAKGPGDPDGNWPCRAICEAMDAIASEHVGKGFHVAVRNSRGAHWRGEGGEQERVLADRYRTWARVRAAEFPFVSAVLESVADSYEREAQREDSDARVTRRLRR